MSVDSIKHGHADRPHIPSQEEAGYEDASPSVQGQARKAEYPVNPVVTRGQDPELFWLGKYGEDDADDRLAVDIRSLYRTEHVAPEAIIRGLHRVTEAEDKQPDLFNVNALFGHAIDRDELSKVSEYYGHRDGWSNRLIQGDSLLVMSSLLEREGMAGQVQMCYIDPPYGIKYGSNWQMKLNSRTMQDRDDNLSGEPEVIKAYRDTWELGIHSYLSYLRDRLLVTRELLADTGSVFVQISDENVHLVRSLLDEIFGAANFVSQITFVKTSSATAEYLPGVADYILWYSKDRERMKYRPLYKQKVPGGPGATKYTNVELSNGERRPITPSELGNPSILPRGARLFTLGDMSSQSEGRAKGEGAACWFPVELDGESYTPPGRRRWATNEEGMDRLKADNRLYPMTTSLRYIRYLDDFPVYGMTNVWDDIGGIQSRKDPKRYKKRRPNGNDRPAPVPSHDVGPR